MAAVSGAQAEFAIAKQSAEGTGATNPEYAMPVFEGLPRPVQSIEQVAVTDVDLMPQYMKVDEHFEANLVVPGLPQGLGRIIKFMFPTDTKTGAGDPYTHTFTIAGTEEWATLFSRRPGGASPLYEKFVDGRITELSFSFAKDTPLRVGANFVGKTPSVLASAYTSTTTEKFNSAGEYLRSAGGTLKFDEDSSTENTHTNILSGTLRIARPVEFEPIASSINPSHAYAGLYTFGVALELMWENYEAYRATYFGGVSGTDVSETIVWGSLDFTFAMYSNTNHSLQIEMDKVAFIVPEAPAPDAGGGPFHMSVDGFAIDPVSTEPCTIKLKNGVSTAY